MYLINVTHEVTCIIDNIYLTRDLQRWHKQSIIGQAIYSVEDLKGGGVVGKHL